MAHPEPDLNMAPAGARPLLLCVDDQVFNLHILQAIFQADHEVAVASSGAEALAFCEQQLPDLILLDVEMAEMDGHELCRRLKADARTAAIPVIFLTGRTNPQDETRALQTGAVDYIAKPINPDVVRARVHTHLTLLQARRHIEELNDTLERRVHQRSLELEAALLNLHESQKELVRSEAAATLSTMIASVSHELGTPIGNGKMAAGTLAELAGSLQQALGSGQLKRSDLARFLSDLSSISLLLVGNMERADTLINKFRQVAADQASEQRRSFSVATVIQEVLATMSPGLRQYAHQVVVDIAPEIIMDSLPGPLGQIIINLVNNAYTHAFPERSGGLVRIDGQREGESVRISVSDNGVGIAEQHLEAIFKPFFSTRIGQGGTGLGMMIVESLARQSLGGSVTLESSPGKGTTVTLLLPAVLPAQLAEATS
jgi:signal transduction histidine kinase